MITLILFLLGLIIAFFTATYVIYRIAFLGLHKKPEEYFNMPDTPAARPYRERTLALMKEVYDLPFESIEIKSHDGIKLFGRYYKVQDGAPIDICFHGWHGNYLQDFCGGALLCKSAGHNFILVDQRGQGFSDSSTMSFGVLEKYDVVTWCNYVVQRFGSQVQINLIGISMGAATVLQAATQPLPPNVKHIFADCPYSSPVAIIHKVAKNDMHLPVKLVHPFIVAAARIYGHFNLMDKTSDVPRNIGNCKIPILIIHGEQDNFVPAQMSKEIADANTSIQRHTFPGANHGLSFMLDEKRYEKLVTEFLLPENL